MVGNADDARVGWNLRRQERKGSLTPTDEEDLLANTGANRIDTDQVTPDRLPIRCQRLQHQQLQAAEPGIFSGSDDRAGDARKLHYRFSSSTVSTMPTIAASTGMSLKSAAIRAELPLTIRTVSP